jgi:N-acyl amino acid synthase of PEP-CTERM/exosortase system
MNPPLTALEVEADGPDNSAGPHPPIAGLKGIYDSFFRVVPADTNELREQSFRLRYQVYCVENPFEPVAENPGERETDQYDAQSVHSLLLHHPTGAVVGTTRLILPGVNGHAHPLPVHTLCSPDLLARFAHRIPAGGTAELSRFAVAKEFRRRVEDRDTIAGGLSISDGRQPRRAIPHISLGLMQSALAMSTRHRITHICAVMEPSLLRMLRHLGIHFENLGPLVEFHGRRQPCFCDIEQLLARTWEERPDVWEVLTDGARLRPPPAGN